MLFHIWPWVSRHREGGIWERGDQGNKKPEPWRSFSSDSILNLKIRFLSCRPPLRFSSTIASCNHSRAAWVRTRSFNLINPNTELRESGSLCRELGDPDVWFQPSASVQLCCLDPMWRTHSVGLAHPKNEVMAESRPEIFTLFCQLPVGSFLESDGFDLTEELSNNRHKAE